MDETERLAREHLRFRGFSDVVYEPDGNVPPDFLVGASIAVEVRQLNQHDVHSGKSLDAKGIPFVDRLSNLLRSQPASRPGPRFIGIFFRRPLPKWKPVEAGVREFLRRVDSVENPVGLGTAIGNLELEVVALSPEGPGRYVPGILLDYDAGGAVLGELDRNLRLCVEEKSRKVKVYRTRYREWWLLLVDRLTYGLSDDEREMFLDRVDLVHDWNKIIIVDPSDISRCIEL
jgi:hypothetical protein